jgi:DNA (cytosine-5)-methyltransferase 1
VKPKLLDLFSGAGGAARGYQMAGFEVHGVDVKEQPRYVGERLYRTDALEFVAEHGREYDAIHASPPCQAYSTTKGLHGNAHPTLIEPTRAALLATGLPYVIENVRGAPLLTSIVLCGSMFGLGVRRHRLFESNVVLFQPACDHPSCPEPIDVTGTGGQCATRATAGGGLHRKPRNVAHAREVMGIDWMTRRELNESIPPAYTKWIGDQLMAFVGEEAA